MGSLTKPETFRNRACWAFYWLMTNAAFDARTKASDGLNENAISTEFVHSLKDWAARYERAFGDTAGIGLLTAKLFDHLKPNLQEADTGADMVLVVSGRELVGGDGARLIWIQAKRQNLDGDPLRLEYGQANSKHGTQCSALQLLAQTKGSFAFYILYSTRLPFVPAVFAPNLRADDNSVNLADVGERLQEAVSATALSTQLPSFRSPQDVLSFIESVSTNNAMPLQVMAVESAHGTFRERLISLIKARNKELAPRSLSRGHAR